MQFACIVNKVYNGISYYTKCKFTQWKAYTIIYY